MSADLEHLIGYLAGRDEPCPRCRYNLRGLTNPMCPECGASLRLQVGLVEPRMAAYLAMLVAWSVGLGGSALMLLLITTQAPGRWLLDEPSGWILMAQLPVTAIGLMTAGFIKRRFTRWPLGTRVACAIGSWAVVLVFAAAFIAFFNG